MLTPALLAAPPLQLWWSGCHVEAVGWRGPRARNEGSLWPMASKELRLVVRQPQRTEMLPTTVGFGSRSLPGGAHTLSAAFTRDPEQETLLSPPGFLTHGNRGRNCVLFSSAHCAVTFCSTVDNYDIVNTQHLYTGEVR